MDRVFQSQAEGARYSRGRGGGRRVGVQRKEHRFPWVGKGERGRDAHGRAKFCTDGAEVYQCAW